MNRPTIALDLAADELATAAEQLEAAGFGTVSLDSAADLAEVLDAALPIGLAILDANREPDALAEVVGRLRARGTAIPLLLVADLDQFAALHEGSLIGPDDEVVVRPIDPEALRWRAEAMLIRAQVPGDSADGSIIATGAVGAHWAARSPIVAIFNPKGGVGKTTIATNLATALQIRRERQVLLLDADTVTGHVTLSLGMGDGRTIVDAWRDEADGGPAEGILDVAGRHGSGVRVAALVSNPLAMANLDADRVGEAILAARWSVDVVVVDLHPSYSEVNQTIFGIADRILIPVTPDLPAIRAAVQLADVATELGLRDRLAMVVNRANSGVSVKQMEDAVGVPALALIRSGGMLFVRAANEGRTVTEMFPKDPVAVDFEKLADRVLGFRSGEDVTAPKAEPRGLLSGLFGRREPVSA